MESGNSMIRVFLFSIILIISYFKGMSQKQYNQFSYPDLFLLDTNYKTKYPLVNFSKNNFQFFTEGSPQWKLLSQKLDSMIEFKNKKLNFYHIGGSHIQADIYTNDIRTFLDTNWKGINGERGFVFPFDLAKTNNPSNYEFTSPNKWKAYRSVSKEKCELDYGLLGAVITCPDTFITMDFRYDKTVIPQKISKLKIYHNKLEIPYYISFGKNEQYIINYKIDENLGITEVEFENNIDSLQIQFIKKSKNESRLQISGIQLMNNEPGISYTAIGINGAGLYTYLDCGNFEEQLRQAPPDFFAFSVGTNDGNVPYDAFNPEVYKSNLEKMMNMVYRSNPNCAILLTVPNDSYYLKKYLNKNIAREREMIIQLAEKYKVPIWDFYGIMGELGASKTWQLAKLMQPDKVHFTGEGYHLKGSLFIDAFMKWKAKMNEE